MITENLKMSIKRFRVSILTIVILIFVAVLIIFPVMQVYKFENILKAKVQPENGENVFLIDTKTATTDVMLTARQACAIESAALINPHLKIFVIFTSQERLQKLKMTLELDAVLSYPNVFINFVNLDEFSAGSPLEEFIASKKLSTSSFKIEHTSDVLRLLLLWKYGGTYLDTDMIVKKNLKSVPPNFACVQDELYVNGAILNFDNKKGKNLSKIFMNALQDQFDGEFFATNGPVLITSVLKNLCEVENVTEMTSKNDCKGFHVLENNLCYSIPYYMWESLMTDENTEEIMELIEDSIVVHFWNNLSHGKLMSVTSNAPYLQLARKFCPKTMKNVKDFF